MNSAAAKVILSALLIAVLSGCISLNSLKSFSSSVIGNSTTALENEKVIFIKAYLASADVCYAKTLKFLAEKKTGATVFMDKPGEYIIAMHFDKMYKNCTDTTEVGIFFKRMSANKTKIKVSSLNTSLARYVSEKLFKYLAS